MICAVLGLKTVVRCDQKVVGSWLLCTNANSACHPYGVG